MKDTRISLSQVECWENKNANGFITANYGKSLRNALLPIDSTQQGR